MKTRSNIIFIILPWLSTV